MAMEIPQEDQLTRTSSVRFESVDSVDDEPDRSFKKSKSMPLQRQASIKDTIKVANDLIKNIPPSPRSQEAYSFKDFISGRLKELQAQVLSAYEKDLAEQKSTLTNKVKELEKRLESLSSKNPGQQMPSLPGTNILNGAGSPPVALAPPKPPPPLHDRGGSMVSFSSDTEVQDLCLPSTPMPGSCLQSFEEPTTTAKEPTTAWDPVVPLASSFMSDTTALTVQTCGSSSLEVPTACREWQQVQLQLHGQTMAKSSYSVTRHPHPESRAGQKDFEGKFREDNEPGAKTSIASSVNSFDKNIPRLSLMHHRPSEWSCVNGSSNGSRGNSMMEDDFIFQVWPSWNTSMRKSNSIHRRTTVGNEDGVGTGVGKIDENELFVPESLLAQDNADDLNHADFDPISRLLFPFMITPHQPARIAWDLLGIIVLFYDIVMIPMQLLDLPSTVVLTLASWAVRIYWTMDFPSQFITGYVTKLAAVELRPILVAKMYMKTWMAFDATVLCIDWAETGFSNVGAARMGKTVKVIRLFRMLRLIRAKKVQDLIKQWSGVRSEEVVIIAGIFSYLSLVVIAVHFLACCWYGIGGDYPGWRRVEQVDDESLMFKYSTSLHWSMTQIIGNSKIDPHNSTEMLFNIAVLLFTFVMSSMVISAITSSMTRLHIIYAEQSTMVSMLNQYLRDNHISRGVSLRVQRNALYTLESHKRNVPEKNIVLLNYVSEPLRVELHYEIYKPALEHHPFFHKYDQHNTVGMKHVCHTALSLLSLSSGDVLFSDGEVPPVPQMYFVTNGRLRYLQTGGQAPKDVTVNQWAGEGLLWTPWMHCGLLRAKTECSLIVLDALQFQTIAYQFQDADFSSRKFAILFVDALNSSDKAKLTDLGDLEFSTQDIADTVWGKRRHDSQESSPSFSPAGSVLTTRLKLSKLAGGKLTRLKTFISP
eukprot:gnl/TRDRNA2_/TRDRNA2_162643_c1_seq6.p1 gnl/TRDRNA2_/TRDRNA2_162643_c1~~gnl/TRDRNA2_/TRDRNA2_162643_c1_seq6.p1  ORF type:complete len:928 (-),score=151.34 gnl/TRDRNA2_/TRDRNA2_162643_c1_seq6:128-2911(-)